MEHRDDTVSLIELVWPNRRMTGDQDEADEVEVVEEVEDIAKESYNARRRKTIWSSAAFECAVIIILS